MLDGTGESWSLRTVMGATTGTLPAAYVARSESFATKRYGLAIGTRVDTGFPHADYPTRMHRMDKEAF